VLLVLLVLTQFPPQAVNLLQIFGGGFVLYIACGIVMSLRANRLLGQPAAGVAEAPVAIAATQRAIFARMVLINLLNPGPYIFWSTVNGPLFLRGMEQSALHGVAFLLAFYGAFVGLLAAIVLVFDRLRQLDPRITRALLLVATGALVLLGIRLIAQGFGLIA
jgi:threonine/homoserine/homoserine lactone efflux protein